MEARLANIPAIGKIAWMTQEAPSRPSKSGCNFADCITIGKLDFQTEKNFGGLFTSTAVVLAVIFHPFLRAEID
jgi:hypothetical protein